LSGVRGRVGTACGWGWAGMRDVGGRDRRGTSRRSSVRGCQAAYEFIVDLLEDADRDADRILE